MLKKYVQFTTISATLIKKIIIYQYRIEGYNFPGRGMRGM